ncbi:MAG: dTDP-4-amino-4,6-dideoxygalactose transaminase [Magnetococcales bacterium]|nr:dTDP-4-amino-4,6-dideoxygalactose transaminase [Magnetococcales bacterium]MBF0321836.1 dTDP-4-amino-4,6-dideoxygalactose transaminase [Magnetococcales bacterium]
MRIPFNRPSFTGHEKKYLLDAVERGHISGGGYYTRCCEQFLARELGVHRALLTTSCTDALEMVALLLDIQPGDEVIVPSYTFTSTANAFSLRGAHIIFADIRPDTMNLDEKKWMQKISARTKAVVAVHYAGVGCDMDDIISVAAQHGVKVVEDNAHGLFGSYRGRPLGTMGILATQSFHETKNFNCGEGGALLINDQELVERAEILLEKGTNRQQFFRGMVDKYTWVDLGSSYVLADALAAVLYAQFEQRHDIMSARKAIWSRYDQQLAAWAHARGVQRPFVPEYCQQAYHMYYLIFQDMETRQRFFKHLADHDIMSVFHYIPLHLSPMGKKYGARPGDCPVAEKMSDRLARLPFYSTLSEADQEKVISTILSFK